LSYACQPKFPDVKLRVRLNGPDDGLVTLLSVGGRFETVRAVLAAEVFVRRALADRVSGLSESAAADEVRARRLLDEVITAGGDENVERAQALLAELDGTAGEGTSE